MFANGSAQKIESSVLVGKSDIVLSRIEFPGPSSRLIQ